jgi:hypothetical protein
MIDLVDFLDRRRILELLEGLFFNSDHYTILAFKSGSHLTLTK